MVEVKVFQQTATKETETEIAIEKALEHFRKRLWKDGEEILDVSEELMSGYDLKMCQRTGDEIRKIFGNDIGGFFLNRPAEERRYLCNRLICVLGELYGITLNKEAAPCIGVLYFHEVSLLEGVYDRAQNIFYLNLAYLNSRDKGMVRLFIENLIHEFRHAVQIKAIHTADFWEVSKERARLWRWNYDHYQKAERNPAAYFEQPVEADARTFAYLSMKGVR